MQAQDIDFWRIWRLDLAIQPSITEIPKEPGMSS
jgi:hypothetical protein